MIENFTLTYGYWKKISTAGQTGKAWLKSYNGSHPVIKIGHTSEAQNPADDIPILETTDKLNISASYRLPITDNPDILTPDDENDIFYATIRNADKTCEINVDFATI